MLSLGDITKYLGLLSIGKGFVDKAVVKRLLLGIAAVISLTVIAGILVGAIIVTLLALLYHSLVIAGVSSTGSLALVGLLTILVAAAITYRVIQLIKKIASYSAILEQPKMPANPISDIINSFMDGFNHPQPRAPRSEAETGKKPKKHLKPVR